MLHPPCPPHEPRLQKWCVEEALRVGCGGVVRGEGGREGGTPQRHPGRAGRAGRAGGARQMGEKQGENSRQRGGESKRDAEKQAHTSSSAARPKGRIVILIADI